MRRYFARISYEGTNYHGWQRQNNAKTIQQEIENALSKILQTEINVIGCGRTDTGVHAFKFYLHFDYVKSLDLSNLSFSLNNLISPFVAFDDMFEVPLDLHARFSALARTYHYYIHQKKNPFKTNYSYYYRKELDIELMNEAGKKLLNYKDFTSFSKLHTQVKTNDCDITEAIWSKDENGFLTFKISADRFLRNMVRAIVGTMLMVGEKKISVEDFCNIIELKDRGKAGVSVPANGLFLTDVKYANF